MKIWLLALVLTGGGFLLGGDSEVITQLDNQYNLSVSSTVPFSWDNPCKKLWSQTYDEYLWLWPDGHISTSNVLADHVDLSLAKVNPQHWAGPHAMLNTPGAYDSDTTTILELHTDLLWGIVGALIALGVINALNFYFE